MTSFSTSTTTTSATTTTETITAPAPMIPDTTVSGRGNSTSIGSSDSNTVPTTTKEDVAPLLDKQPEDATKGSSASRSVEKLTSSDSHSNTEARSSGNRGASIERQQPSEYKAQQQSQGSSRGGDGSSQSDRRSKGHTSGVAGADDSHRSQNDHSSSAALSSSSRQYHQQDRTSNGHRNDRHRSQQQGNSNNSGDTRDQRDKPEASVDISKQQQNDNSERSSGGGREGGRDNREGRSRGHDQRPNQTSLRHYQGRENNQTRDHDNNNNNKDKDSHQQKDDNNQTKAGGDGGARPDPLSLLSITGRMGLLTPEKPFFGNSRIVDDFEKLNKVGEGTYGVVYRARDKKTGEIVALKRIRMERENDGLPISSLREIKLLKTLRHDNIVLVKDVAVGSDLDQIFLVMEYCEQDMAALMDNVKKPYTPAEVKCLMYQLLKGIEYCHDHYVIHRDLKLSNLLLNGQGILKIADFGLARSFGLPSRPMTPKVVTLWYRAPELLFGDPNYTTAVDMWSAGCIFGEFLKHAPLLPGKVEKQQVDFIIELLGTPHEKIWQGFNKLPMASIKLPEQRFNNLRNKFPNITDAARSLLSGLLTYDPKKRLSVKQALAHPYFIEAPPAKHPSLLPTHPEIRNITTTRNEENAKLKRQAAGDEPESIGNNRKRMR